MEITDYKLEGELLPIHTYPDPVLSQVATKIEVFDNELKLLVKNMLYTMYHAPGIGLAAPQIGRGIRLFVVDVDYDREEVTRADGSTDMEFSNLHPMVFINPELTLSGDKAVGKEGCLSVPDVYEEVQRAEHVVIKYQDLDGNEQVMEADDLLAVCLQHENDHLNGVVFIDRLSGLKKNFFKKKLIKEKSNRF